MQKVQSGYCHFVVSKKHICSFLSNLYVDLRWSIYIVFVFSACIVVSLCLLSVASNINVKLNCNDCHGWTRGTIPNQTMRMRPYTCSVTCRNKDLLEHIAFKFYNHYTKCRENTLLKYESSDKWRGKHKVALAVQKFQNEKFK